MVAVKLGLGLKVEETAGEGEIVENLCEWTYVAVMQCLELNAGDEDGVALMQAPMLTSQCSADTCDAAPAATEWCEGSDKDRMTCRGEVRRKYASKQRSGRREGTGTIEIKWRG